MLSTRATGNTGGEFIKVTDPGGDVRPKKRAPRRKARTPNSRSTASPGSSSSNTVTNAIAGVTLTLGGLTPGGPVTIDVQAPGPSAGAVKRQVQAFVKIYNSTVEAIQKQLTTKPPAKAQSAGEFATGTLFGDLELTSLLDNMRTAMYEPVAGLEAAMSSPFDIGVSTGAPVGGGVSSQASLEGLAHARPDQARRGCPGQPGRRPEDAPAVVAEPAGPDQRDRCARRHARSPGQRRRQPDHPPDQRRSTT